MARLDVKLASVVNAAAPLLATNSQSAIPFNLKAGDILFFSAPSAVQNAYQKQMADEWMQKQLSEQCWLSCFWALFCCGCGNFSDYQKLHVAVCLNSQSAQSLDVQIAHLGPRGYEKKSLKDIYRVHDRKIHTLRPKEAKFAEELTAVAGKNYGINWSYESYKDSVSCCPSSSAAKQEEFSADSNCAQFIADIVTKAANAHHQQYAVSANTNFCAPRLWQILKASNLYEAEETTMDGIGLKRG